MLIDVELCNDNLATNAINEIMGVNPTKVGTGLYMDCGFNFHSAISRDDWDSLYMFDDERGGEIPSYGVVDSVAQFVEMFGSKLEASKHQYAVGFTTVKKSECPPEGGWRWHKWGEYFGVHEITTEYLHDEPIVEEVVTFSVMRKK